MIDDTLRQRIEAQAWYHEFDFGDGIVTKPTGPGKRLWDATETFLDKIDFEGKRVLDIGCWDGYWSFYAERRGAASVLATDLNSQRWVQAEEGLRPAGPSENEGFQIAHEVFQSKVEYMGDVSVYDLGRLQRTFDIVLFLGVYYHLTHAFYAFTQVRHAVAPGGVAVFEGGAVADDARSFTEFYYGTDGEEPYRQADTSNWFMPSLRGLKDMVRSNYFSVEDELFLPDPVPRPSRKERWKKRVQRNIARLCGIPIAQPLRYGRMLLRARAEQEADSNHFYEPQFGLSRYDPRFG